MRSMTFEIAHARDRGPLGRRQVAVKDEGLGPRLHRSHDDVVELAPPHDELRVDALAPLEHDVGDLGACGAGQLAQLAQALARPLERVRPRRVGDVDQDRAAVLRYDLAQAAEARELGFERTHQGADVDRQAPDRHRTHLAVGRVAVPLHRHVVRVHDGARLAGRSELDRRHEIEAQAHQVH